jgi:polysaccharide export outer membrane protein
MRLHHFQLLGLLLAVLAASVLSAFAQEQVAENGVRADETYRIQTGDKLSVKFYSHPELNETSVIVRPDGFIGLQIIEDVRAAGRTTAELRAVLEQAYSETLLQPIISVSVIEFVTPKVFVGGQIAKPGRYALREASTVVQAVFLAGGFTRDANRKMVLVARLAPDGEWEVKPLNVMRVLDPKNPDRDVELRDGDYVFVPDSKMSQFNKAVETFRGLLPRFF